MVTLTAKDYYELSYDLIPDNKIQQVLGTTYEYSTSETSDDKEVVKVLKLKGTSSREWTLPAISKDLWDTTDNYFVGSFLQEEATYKYTQPATAQEKEERIEIIYADVYVDIYNDQPMTYTSGVTISSAEGVHRTRIANAGSHAPGWANNFGSSTSKIYGVANYNVDGISSTKSESEVVNVHDIKSVEVDETYNGSKLDPVKNKYRLMLKITLPVYYASMYCLITEGEYAYTNEAQLAYDMYTKVTLIIPYSVKVTKEVEFEYHLDTTNYTNYSLKVTGNEFTTLTNIVYKTKVNEYINGKVDSSYKRMVDSTGSYKLMRTGVETYKRNLWPEATFSRITEKYKDGKLYVSMRMKMSSAIKYLLNIDTELMLKDLNNKLIMIYDGDYYYNIVFKVKNIEYDCSETGYVANITLLEERGEKVTNYVVDSNDLPVVLSTGKKLYF